ncbi:hypothetical protein KC959_02385 [Candidatus Saccharibacteria bacterium]|nr:hypothetical protein [Candidatus Saccharibacteria bacterium]
MNRIKRILLTTAAALGLVMPLAAPAMVSAAEPDSPPEVITNVSGNLNCGAALDFDGSDCDNSTAGTDVDNLVTSVINIISLVVGVVAVIMIIIGGLRYITSGGESGSVTGAKNTIMYAIVGLIVVALAQVIVRFVVNKSTLPE